MKMLLLSGAACALCVSSGWGATIMLTNFSPSNLSSSNAKMTWTNNAATGNILNYYAVSFNVTSSAIALGTKPLVGMDRGSANAATGLVLMLGGGSGTSFDLVLGTGNNGTTEIGRSAAAIDTTAPITMIYRAGTVSVYSGGSLIISATVTDQDAYRMEYNDSSFWTNGAAQTFTGIQALSGDSSMTEREALLALGITPDPVPEPATASLTLLGLAGLVARRRR